MAGYCNRHQMKKGQQKFERCKGIAKTQDCGLKYWIGWEQGRFGATAPEQPVLDPKGFCGESHPYGPGTELIGIYKNAGVPTCQECIDLAEQMDAWGPDVCLEKIEFLIEDILPRAKSWVEQNKPWIHKLLPNAIEDTAIRFKIRMDIKDAIARAKKKTPVKLESVKTPVVIKPKKKGCGCG